MTGPSSHVEVRVSAGAGRSALVGRHGSGWKVRISSPAERGKANEALLTLFASMLEIPRGHVSLVRGATQRDKVLAFDGLSQGDLEIKLAAASSASQSETRT